MLEQCVERELCQASLCARTEDCVALSLLISLCIFRDLTSDPYLATASHTEEGLLTYLILNTLHQLLNRLWLVSCWFKWSFLVRQSLL